MRSKELNKVSVNTAAKFVDGVSVVVPKAHVFLVRTLADFLS